MKTLTFNNTQLSITEKDNQIWLTSNELAKALNYKSSNSVSVIYNRNSDEFTSVMSTVVNLTTVTGMPYQTRIFSLRGCHLIAMFAKTNIAKEFRKWVLDVLDKEAQQSSMNLPHNGRWLVIVKDNKTSITNIDGQNCVNAELHRQLQYDAAYFANELKKMLDNISDIYHLTQNFAARTRITSGDCDPSLFDKPLKMLLNKF